MNSVSHLTQLRDDAGCARHMKPSPFPTMVCISPVGSTLARHRYFIQSPKCLAHKDQMSDTDAAHCTSATFSAEFSAGGTWHTFLPRAIEALVSRHLSVREHRSKMLQESGFGHFWTMICHVESPLRQKDSNKMEKIAKDGRSLSVFFNFLRQLGEIKTASGSLC